MNSPLQKLKKKLESLDLMSRGKQATKTVTQSYADLGKGIGTGIQKVFRPATQQVSAANSTLASKYAQGLSKLDFLPDQMQMKFGQAGTRLAGDAYRKRAEQGLLGSGPNKSGLKTLGKGLQNTFRAQLGTAGFAASPATLATTAGLSGGLNYLLGDKRQSGLRRIGEGVGQAPLYAGFGKASQSITSPVLSRIAPTTGVLAPRIAGSVGNVIEGKALDTAAGEKRIGGLLGSTAIDAAAGFIGGVQAPNALRSNFRLDPDTYKELIQAEDMIKSPRKYLGDITTGAKTEKEALKRIQERGVEMVERLSAKYMPDKQLDRFKTPQAKIKALVDLHYQNKLANVPGMGIVGSKTAKPQAIKGVREVDFEAEMNALNAKPLKKSTSKTPPGEISANEKDQQLTRAVIGEEDKVFKDTFAKWIGEREAARTTGATRGMNFRDIPKNKAGEFIDHAEGVIKSKDPEIVKRAGEWKKTTDALYKEIKSLAKSEGIDMGYVEQYVTHYWKQSPEEVQKILSAKGRSFGRRNVPTYKEGIAVGLTPKYENPAEILSEYVTRLEQTRANIGLFKTLKQQGLIVPASVGRNTPGFSSIQAPGFPRSVTSFEGKVFDGTYYAPDSVANQINRIFKSEDFGGVGKAFGVSSSASRKLQDVILSGGVPKTALNAFTLAQVTKELTSGSVRRPIKALAMSLSPETTMRYFKENAEQIKKMQLRNVGVRSSFDTQGLMGGGSLWDKTMSDPTFKRFMPVLQIEMFNAIEAQAIKAGKSEIAADIAAKAVKNFYGLTDTAAQAQRSKLGKDIVTTFAFAPTYRESMINFWVNSVKGIKNPLALENRQNLKFLAGAAITYATMNHINQVLNGHPMSQNPQGKEDKLLIPVDEKTTIGVPFLSSIATVPRGMYRVGKSLAKLDLKNAGADTLKTFGSMLVKPAGELMLNEDYFGKQIYDENATAGERGKQIASYLFRSNQHPYLRAALEAKGTPPYQTLSKAAELPLRFYSTQSIAAAPFWENYNEAKTLDERFQQLRYEDPQKALEFYNQNQAKLDSLPSMKQQVSAYYDSGKNVDVLAKGNITQTSDNVSFVGTDGKFHQITIDFDRFSNKPEDALERTRWERDRLDAAIKIYRTDDLTGEEKEALIAKLGEDSQTIAYYDIASDDNNVRRVFTEEYLYSLDPSKDRLDALSELRRSIKDKRILTDTLIDDLVDDGLLTAPEGKYLKSVQYDEKTGSYKQKKKSGRKINLPLPKIPTVKIQTPAKMPAVKLSSGSSPRLKLTSTRRSTPKVRLRQLSTPKLRIENSYFKGL